ncbi:MAG: hypothetical protein ABSB74_00345 [Tepidisphaeraceae bacterium]
MEIRKAIQGKPLAGVGVAVLLLLVAGTILTRQFWPEKRAKLSQAYYSDDDGQTWFQDSVYRAAPFDHNGRSAVIAEIYNYDNGGKEFCAYLAKFTPEAKSRLEKALADAEKSGLSPSSVTLYRDPSFMGPGMLVKKPGSKEDWVSISDPRANDVRSVHSPDGSAVDEVFVY